MYRFFVILIIGIFNVFNGKPHVIGKDKLPEQPVIYAISHRSAFDPFYIAMITHPREISFIAKESLFSNKLFAWILTSAHVFPVNRENPSPKVLKKAINVIKKEHMNLGIFPSGSRYSTEIKSGTALIHKMSQADIVPITIQPPMNLKEFFSRKKAKIAIGQSIQYNPRIKYDRHQLSIIDKQIELAFDQLDKQLDPDFVYNPEPKK